QQFGIIGVAIAISTSVVLITFLHLATLWKAIDFSIPKKDVFKMILLVSITYFAGYLLKLLFGERFDHLLILISIFMILTFIYLLLVILLRFMTKDELKQIPYLNKFF